MTIICKTGNVRRSEGVTVLQWRTYIVCIAPGLLFVIREDVLLEE